HGATHTGQNYSLIRLTAQRDGTEKVIHEHRFKSIDDTACAQPAPAEAAHQVFADGHGAEETQGHGGLYFQLQPIGRNDDNWQQNLTLLVNSTVNQSFVD